MMAASTPSGLSAWSARNGLAVLPTAALQNSARDDVRW
jgi:hypothetical protein